MSAYLEKLKVIQLTEYEKHEINKYKVKNILKNSILMLLMILFVILLIYHLVFSIEQIQTAIILFLFCILFIYVAYIFGKQMVIAIKFNINNVKGIRLVITEKTLTQSNQCTDGHNGDNIFVASKLNNDITIYANCSRKQYNKVIVNKTVGLFYSIDNENIRLILTP